MSQAAQVGLLAALVYGTSTFRVRPSTRKHAAAATNSGLAELHEEEALSSHNAAFGTNVVASQPEASATLQKAAPVLLGPAYTTVGDGEPGQVDFVLNFGAPGGASPGLKNWRSKDSCFQGMRIYQAEAGDYWGEWVDVVTRIGNAGYYWHPHMPSMKIDVDGHKSYEHPCELNHTYEPGEGSVSTSLHDAEQYIDSIDKVFNDPWYTNTSIFAGRHSYMNDTDHVFQQVQEYGWGLVGSAAHAGGTVYGGAQITHLIQHPITDECVLTFQGTAAVQGWVSNFHIAAHHFCGLVDEDEECSGWGTCETRHPKGSFVHGGFKERLLAIIMTSDFQTNIRPHLGRCSRVLTVGHSLGGAVAELFAACASRAPQPGEYGYDDYKHMAWTKEAPAKLSYITEPPMNKGPPTNTAPPTNNSPPNNDALPTNSVSPMNKGPPMNEDVPTNNIMPTSSR